MGRGSSKASGKLKPLPDNIIGGKKFNAHEALNSKEARGTNDIRFFSELKDSVELNNGYAEGSFEIRLSNGERERVRGLITVQSGRAYGIRDTGGRYDTTDLRTGIKIGDDSSLYQVNNTILTFNDGFRRDSFKERVAGYERDFDKTKKKRSK